MRPNYTLTVAGSKGGVGKTTTSINLGACFAEEGYRTVVVEADLPMANLVDFITLDIDVTEAETLHDVLAGEAPVTDAVYDVDECLAVVPSGTDIDRYQDVDVEGLEPALEHLWWHYDVIILDTPAGMSGEVKKPIELADETVLVSTPRVSSLRNTSNTSTIVRRADTDVRGLILTKSDTGASPGPDRIADFLELDLLGRVPESAAVPHSQDHGEPVVDYAPTSDPALGYRKITANLIDAADISATTTARSGPPDGAGSTVDDGTENDGDESLVGRLRSTIGI